MGTIFSIVFLLISVSAFAQDSSGQSSEKVIYKYKNFETFDFSDLEIEGDSGSPGDISVNPRLEKKFKNKLPRRDNFFPEMKQGVANIK